MQRRIEVAAVFCAAALVLGWGAGAAGMATTYVDPVSKIVAQDEAVYASTTFGMVASGDWITPRFLGRYALYKPPLTYWLAGLSVKLLGRTPFAVRVPSILAGAATVTIVFCWLQGSAALAGSLLLLSSHLFFALSRTGLTDGLLTLEMTAAMYALARDPSFRKRGTAVMFGCAFGAAIMTKALAGLFPMFALAIVWIFSKERAPLSRLAQAVGIAAAIAVPWYAWQLYAHPRWFWHEYFLTEILAWGVQSPIQNTQESQVGFYMKRLFWLDPALLVLCAVALVKVRPRIPIVWITVILVCACAFQYRNASYLMPIFPAMAIVAASAIPKRWSAAALAISAVLCVAKITVPVLPLGSTNPSHAALDQYASMHRGNELIIIEPDDQFYSADLNLPRVRYCYLDPRTDRRKYPLDFEYLGITVTAEQFARMDELRPVFAQRLREFNLESAEPIATVILARDQQEIDALIRSHPESDFYLSSRRFVLSSVMIQRP